MKDLADQIFLRAACAKIKRAAVFYQGNYKSPFSSRFKETKSLLFLTDSRRSRISYQYKWFKLVSRDTHTGETRFSYINGFMTIFSWVEKNNNSETNKNELNWIFSIKFIFGNFKDLVEIYSMHFWLDISQKNARFSWVRFSNFTSWIFWNFCMNKLWNFASRFFHVLGKIFDFVLAKKRKFLWEEVWNLKSFSWTFWHEYPKSFSRTMYDLDLKSFNRKMWDLNFKSFRRKNWCEHLKSWSRKIWDEISNP